MSRNAEPLMLDHAAASAKPGRSCATLRHLLAASEARALPPRWQRVLAWRFQHPRLLAAWLGGLGEAEAARDASSRWLCSLTYLRFQCLEVLGQGQPLGPELQRLQALSLEQGWNPEQARLLCAMGRLAYSRGDYGEAAQCWSAAMQLARLSEVADAEVEARVGLGQIYDALGNGHTAARLHGDAARLAESSQDDYLVSKVAINQGFNLRVIGRAEAAGRAFERGLEAARRGAIRHYEGECLWQLADLALQQQALELAAIRVEQARKLAEAADNRWLLSGVYRTLAQIKLAQGESEAARSAFERALNQAEQTGARRQAADCLDALALLAEQAGDLSRALRHTRAAKALQAGLLDQLHVAENLDALRQYDLSEPPPLERMLLLSEELQQIDADRAQALQRLTQAGALILRADVVSVWYWPDGAAVSTADAGLAPDARPQWQRYVETLRQSQRPPQDIRVLHDLRAHPDVTTLRPVLQSLGLGSAIEVPLRQQGRWLGLLLLARQGPPRPWSREDVLLASHLGSLCSHIEAKHQTQLAHEALLQANRTLEQRVMERTAELEFSNHALALANESLTAATLTDPLTGLHNRRFLEQHIASDLGLAQRDVGRTGLHIVAYLIDIDHFKAINDQHGHGVGDQTLVEAARRLKAVCRQSSYLVRLGGEEFLLVDRGMEAEQSPHLAERICEVFRTRDFELGPLRLRVRCSVGFACFPLAREQSILSWHEVLELADQAMYQVKREGRDGWMGIAPAPGRRLPPEPQPLSDLLASGCLQAMRGRGAAAAPD